MVGDTVDVVISYTTPQDVTDVDPAWVEWVGG